MPSAIPRHRREKKPAEADVRRKWEHVLTMEQRDDLMTFTDPILIDRIRSSLQDLFERHTLMVDFGLAGFVSSNDPFDSSLLLKEAFQLTLKVARLKHDPGVVRPTAQTCLAMKSTFLERKDFFERLRDALPDFLSPTSLRTILPRARWKEIWAPMPSSLGSAEELLAKLVEQALWNMATDPQYDEKVEVVKDPDGDQLVLDSWMVEHDAKASKAANKKKKQGRISKIKVTSTPLEPMVEETARETWVENDDAQKKVVSSHYWASRSETIDAKMEDHIDASASSGTTLDDVKGHYLQTPPLKHDEDDDDAGWSTGPTMDGASPSILNHSEWQPGALVCYLWGQTSQFSLNGPALERPTSPRSFSSSSSIGSSLASTRGSWSRQAQTPVGADALRASIRNTFLEVDSVRDSVARTPRASSTPAEVRYGHKPMDTQEEVDPWVWYWH